MKVIWALNATKKQKDFPLIVFQQGFLLHALMEQVFLKSS